MAASRGSSRLKYVRNCRRRSLLTGMRLGCLDEVGARREAPLRMECNSFWFMLHGCPCSMCHACSPAVQFDSADPEYAPAQLVRKDDIREGEAGQQWFSVMLLRSQNT